MRSLAFSATGRLAIAVVAALLLTGAFFAAIGREPVALLWLIARSAAGDGYALTESLVRTTPILLCALATALPARIGLITVGAEGQIYVGALLGTGFMLANSAATGVWPCVAMLVVAMLAAAAWSMVPALLKARLGVNETIVTLLTNYIAALLVTWVVYGPWKNPASQGWPATAEFPAPFKPPTFFDSRVHVGLWLAIALAVALHLTLTRTRWGLTLDILRSNPRAGIAAGLHWRRNIVLTMALGGMLAGLAGILETASIQGRLQANISAGAGFSGFLVAWLARNDCLRILPLSLLVGALLASGDGLQMLADLPSSISLVVQGLLFVGVLFAGGCLKRLERSHG
ncbi:MAG: ABC transporter permease [Betaproteobacteria bacterium]